MRHLVADAVGGGDLVDRALDVVADGGRRVEQDDAVGRRQERGLVDAVGDPVEIPLDPADVVALLVESGAERRARDRRVVGQARRVGRGHGLPGHLPPYAGDATVVHRTSILAVDRRRSNPRNSLVVTERRLSHAAADGRPVVAGRAVARPATRARGARPAAGRRARRSRRRVGGARRAGRRQDRAARVRGRGWARVSGRPDRGVEGEMELPFAALQQLCSPILELIGASPEPQRDALGVAFGLRPGHGAEPVPRRAGGPRPALRGRRASSRSCAWSTTRSGSTRVGAGARVRGPPPAWRRRSRSCSRRVSWATRSAGLPQLHVEPLGRRDARALLESVLAGAAR